MYETVANLVRKGKPQNDEIKEKNQPIIFNRGCPTEILTLSYPTMRVSGIMGQLGTIAI